MSLSYFDKKVYLTNLSFWGENKLSKIHCCQPIRKIFDKKKSFLKKKKKIFLPTYPSKKIDVSSNKTSFFFRPKTNILSKIHND